MRMRSRAVLIGLASISAAAGVLAATPVASLASASGKPHTAVCRAHPQPVALLGSTYLAAAGAASTCDAWAVGSETSGGVTTNAIENWNGKAWTLQAAPDPAPPAASGYKTSNDQLDGITVVSATDAWAVGFVSYANNGVLSATLILHWNGKAWKAVKSPDPGGPFQQNQLVAVSAAAANDIWAVGNYTSGGYQHSLAEHWNGKSWSAVASPSPSAQNEDLYAVAATSATSAWAGGTVCRTASVCPQVVQHWNGHHWSVAKLPVIKGESYGSIQGLSTYGGTQPGAWAAGFYQAGSSDNYQVLILRWNGHSWKRTAVKGAPLGGGLFGVDAFSASSAIAVGTNYATPLETSFIARWNGKRWTFANAPAPYGSGFGYNLAGVGGGTCSDAWAVGSAYEGSDSSARDPLGLHC